MYNLHDIGLSKQHREELAQQVDNTRLARQLRVYSRMASGTKSALAGRVFAWSLRKGQTAGC
jgi:hypothetical protein